MLLLNQRVDQLVHNLKQFSDVLAVFQPPADPALITAFETQHHLCLPADYKRVLMHMNGFSLMGNDVYGIDDSPTSLAAVYHREHALVNYPQDAHLVPFSDDGRGNFYCFDTRFITTETATCPIIFWVSNYVYTADDQPDVVYDDFIACVQEVIIDWALEDHDHDGNELQL